MCYMLYIFCVFERERLEDNPHNIMFGSGPEKDIFDNIAPYVSFGYYYFHRL